MPVDSFLICVLNELTNGRSSLPGYQTIQFTQNTNEMVVAIFENILKHLFASVGSNLKQFCIMSF